MDISDVVKKVQVQSVKGLFELISPFGEYKHIINDYVFRGESSGLYQLLPSALRRSNKENLYSLATLGTPIADQSEWETWQITAEYFCLRNFFTISDNNGLKVPDVNRIRERLQSINIMQELGMKSEKWLPNDLYELAALAQHYGIPTRLIDWTYDSHIALYFAARGAIKKSKTEDFMVLWAINLTYIEFLYPTTQQIPLIFIKPPYSNNPNLHAQKGILSYWASRIKSFEEVLMTDLTFVDRTPLDKLIYNKVIDLRLTDFENNNNYLMYKFEIPIQLSHELLSVLHKLNYNATRIFPGYNGVTKYMIEKSLIKLE